MSSSKKGSTKDKPEKQRVPVVPYSEGNPSNLLVSPLQAYIKGSIYVKFSQLFDRNNDQQDENKKNEMMTAEYWEKRFTKIELAKVREDFNRNAKDSIISKRSLFEFLGLAEIVNTTLARRIFSAFKLSAENYKNPFLDYPKFVRTIAVLRKGSIDERVNFIYSLFDLNGDKYVEKQEMIEVFQSFVDAMKLCTFEPQQLKNLKGFVNDLPEFDIRAHLAENVDEIYLKYSIKQEGNLPFP